MIFKLLICWSLLYVPSQQLPPMTRRCLTGYMTDIQTWVDSEGNLIPGPNSNSSIDLSSVVNVIVPLFQRTQNFANYESHAIRFLSIARCRLNQVPSVFDFVDPKGRPLSLTLEYLTLYGNSFLPLPIEETRYDVLMNATGAKEVSTDLIPTNKVGLNWWQGLQGVRFQRLRELDLRSCGIQNLSDNIFSGMPSLERLYIGKNNIHYINTNAFAGLSNLRHLDLSRNFQNDENEFYKGLYVESINILEPLVNLTSLDFSYTNIAQRNMLIFTYLSPKLERLSICYTGLINMRVGIFNGTSMRLLDVSGNFNILSDLNILQGIESTLQVLYAEDVALRQLNFFKYFSNLEILKLSNNEISAVNRNMVSNLTKLQVLDLDTNRLTTWFEPTFSLMPNLKLLSIRDNNINIISEEMTNDFANISYIGLSGNFMVCNCHARELYEVALRNEKLLQINLLNTTYISGSPDPMYHTGFEDYNALIERRVRVTCEFGFCGHGMKLKNRAIFLLLDYHEDRYQCLLPIEGISIPFHKVPTCKHPRDLGVYDLIRKPWNKLYLLTLLLLLLPILALVFIFRKNIRYFCITMRNSAMLSLISKDEVIDDAASFQYDVFVSYCNEDRAWILDQLLPHVENDCNISVCLHERDFMVGLSILENIVSCMDRSKAIMLIISQRFLLSQWCQFEMHLAQHRLLETRREDLILVLLEDIPRRMRPNTLHYLMVTNTYIVWPKEESEQSLFWRRIKKSLVIHKLKRSEDVSLA